MSVNLYSLLERLMHVNTETPREDIAAEMIEVAKQLHSGNASPEVAADTLEVIAHLITGKLSPGKVGS